MPHGNGRFKKLDRNGGRYIEDADSKQFCYHVDNPQKLLQAAGYLKHVFAVEKKTGVFARGQSKLYPTLHPSLFRGLKKLSAANERTKALDAALAGIDQNKLALKAVNPDVREPLLQHYGIRTRWLDVVDNIWVALWFACFDAISAGKNGRFLTFQRRGEQLTQRMQNYAYILLIEAPVTPDPTRVGFFRSPFVELVDLRAAAPSQFVRPHAQHALLLRKRLLKTEKDLNYFDLIAGIIRVKLDDALNWLGHGALVSPTGIFPSAVFDSGYRELLVGCDLDTKVLGCVHEIGP